MMTLMDDIQDKVALVTGASRGIGRAIAVALAREGALVGLNYIAREAEARETAREIEKLGRRCAVVQADVSTSAGAARLVSTVEAELGPVSILVNNAGISRRQPLDQITGRDWDELIAVNLTSCFLMTQAVVPGMRERHWARIVNLSSVAAQMGGVVGPHYAASKAGMIGLTHSYAALLVKEGITANAIAPALIETEMVTGNIAATADWIPMGRFGTVEEVAAVALMLVRDGFITGQTINVNGCRYMSS
jgi:3-oxoacyl-[acyl-carrier protein] reductase